MNMSITGSLEPVSEGDLRELERVLGVRLPDDYRNFLLQHNGGYPHPNIFPIAGCPRSNFGVLTWLLSVKEGKYNLLRYAQLFKDRIPPNLLPIGHDPGGNLVCISVGGNDRGTVYFWEHEFEVDECELPSYDNVYFVADNFHAFMEALTMPKE